MKEKETNGQEIESMKTCHQALKELSPEAQSRVLNWLVSKLKIKGESDKPLPEGKEGEEKRDTPTSKEFVTQKKSKSAAERIASLAFYITHYQKTLEFKTQDLVKLNKNASQPPFTNPWQATADATKAEFLAPAGRGRKMITSRGEALVHALPDREKVKEALKANPRTRRRKKGGKALGKKRK